MQMRIATAGDGALIARLHTASWRSAYRAILDPAFLAGPIVDDRLSAWMSRIAQQDQHELIIAEAADEPVGFICAIGAEDDQWGTLIDNLHLLPVAKGRGLGAALFKTAAEWSVKNYRNWGVTCGVTSRTNLPAASTNVLAAQSLSEACMSRPAEASGPLCASIGPIRPRRSASQGGADYSDPTLNSVAFMTALADCGRLS